MDVNAVANDTRATAGVASTRAKMSQKEFMKLLIAEMSHQDPLQPMENQQFAQQLASLQTLESSAALTDGISQLVRLQQLTSASSLIGKMVAGVDANGDPVRGKVDRVAAQGNEIMLSVGGQSVPLTGVSEVSADVQ